MNGTPDEATIEARRAARRSVERALMGNPQLGISLPEQQRPKGVLDMQALRRGPGRGAVELGVGTATLVDLGDGVCVWRDGFGPAPASGARRRRGPANTGMAVGTVVTPVVFATLKPNEVIGYLAGLDEWLTPHKGLRRWVGPAALKDWDGKDETLFKPLDFKTERPQPKPPKRTLLFVHGTFSQCKALIQGLQQTQEGREFLDRAQNTYDSILAFDHPTLSVSPVLNGMDLSQWFADVKTPLDIICHSRGGLVVRWWLEAFGGSLAGPRRVVMVGSPLAGTSLAAPDKLRGTLDWFTSVGLFLEKVGEPFVAIPYTGVALGLLKVVNSIVGTVAHTPLVDAAFAMIPGLAGQSRVRNNYEIIRLRDRSFALPPEYSFVKSDFRPDPVGWKFWKAFVNFGDRAKDALFGAVFQDMPNDLIVDTDSMNDLIEEKLTFEKKRVLDFGQSPKVHHTNYFSQKETAKFIIEQFQLNSP